MTRQATQPLGEFLHPRRAAWSVVHQLCADMDEPERAWARLCEHGVLPSDWRASPRRRFVLDGPEPTRDPAFAPTGAHPGTVERCMLVASDVEGMLAAERAALEVAARLTPWGAPPCDRIVWWMIPRDYYGYASVDTRPGVSYALVYAFASLSAAVEADGDRVANQLFGHVHHWTQAWAELAAAGARIQTRHPCPARGLRFGDLADPFESLAAVEASGYAMLEYVGKAGSSRGAVVVVAPTDQP